MRIAGQSALAIAVLAMLASCAGETTVTPSKATPPSSRKVSRDDPFKPGDEVLIDVARSAIFSEPSHVSDPVAKVKEGEKVRVIEDKVGPSGFWVRVEFNGKIGYIRRSGLIARELFAPAEN